VVVRLSIRGRIAGAARVTVFAALVLSYAIVAHSALPCGTRDGALREPTADDALFVLEAAIGLPGRCGRCLCDVDSGGSITVRDAVLVLLGNGDGSFVTERRSRATERT